MSFNASEFNQVQGDDEIKGLFKLCAFDAINSGTKDAQQKQEISIRYQVLCDETAMVGVVKQTEKSSGQMVEIGPLAFGRATVKAAPKHFAAPGQTLSRGSDGAKVTPGGGFKAVAVRERASRGGGDPESLVKSFYEVYDEFKA